MRLRQSILALCFFAAIMSASSAFAQKSQDLLRFGLGGALDVIDPYYTGDREVTMVVGEMVQLAGLKLRFKTTFTLCVAVHCWPCCALKTRLCGCNISKGGGGV